MQQAKCHEISEATRKNGAILILDKGSGGNLYQPRLEVGDQFKRLGAPGTTIGIGVCDVTSNSSKTPKAKRNRFGAHVPYKWEKEAFLRDLDADPTLNSGTKAVTRVIAHNYDEDRNQSVASVSYIAKATGMSVRAVKYNVPHVLTSFRASRLRKGIGTASSVWAVHWWCRGSSFIREKFGDVVTDIRTKPISSGANAVTSPKISGANDDTGKSDTDCTTKN